MGFLYLHETSTGIFWLSHRLVPEVRGMLAAMSSRAPVGGINARYKQIVEAVAEGLFLDRAKTNSENPGPQTWAELEAYPHEKEAPFPTTVAHYRILAENRMCEYPLHPKVQRFFDDFVGKYGHSSVMELVGGQVVFAERISWLTAWLLFDSPLCTGQEFSTRAVQHADWPLARECFSEGAWHPDLVELHHGWFEIFEAEVAWWKQHLMGEENRKALGIGDKEPFRPALDRARWALPGTISTGCGHTSHLRERARVLRDGSLLAQASKATAATQVWEEITEAYQEALPGLQNMGLREAVYGADSQIPGHLRSILSSAPEGPDAEITLVATGGLDDVSPFHRFREKTYLDPLANSLARVNITFRCSLAVARDWHRQRTAYPWHLQVVRSNPTDSLRIDPHYEPKSELALAKLPMLLRRSTEVFDRFMADQNVMQAALALPLGTRVRIRGQAGLRDSVYLLELRKYAHGANFEYQDQATKALDQLNATLPDFRALLKNP